MLQILPAIDLRGGRCVRLRQGNYDDETVFGDDPAAAAERWVGEGARFLHLVDLDGARQGRPVNEESIRRIVRTAGVPCQVGGGFRDDAHVAEALGWGVERVVLGTRALQDPPWLEGLCRRHPGRLVLSLDARDGRLATDGWRRDSGRSALEAAFRCAELPLAAIAYTDIGRDGMLAGPNFGALAELVAAVSLPLIASGGVTTVADVRRLAELGLAGCIIGRALYEGQIRLPAALAAVPAEGPRPAD